MKETDIVLSILIISHNQKEKLERCLESILKQEIHYSHEIIISDDNSTDGTWEFIQEFESKYTGEIITSQINSNDCNPANSSQRSGYNRCNAYKLSRGKYIVHIDGDDYLVAGNVYQRQVELQEKYPTCSLCMQNIWIINEGADFETGRPWFPMDKFRNEQIISTQEFIKEDYFILNQAFVIRRNPDVDPVSLYGKRYVDSVITYHHLQFGEVVCVDRCNYIYVKHPSAITETLPATDRTVLWCRPIHIPLLIPSLTGTFYASHLKDILHLVNMVRKGATILKESADSIYNMGAYIFDIFSKPDLSVLDKIRLNSIRLFIILLIKLDIVYAPTLRLLHCLMVSPKINKNARFSI
jgi:glycosyltransferase involved in cell wall biosynthesis